MNCNTYLKSFSTFALAAVLALPLASCGRNDEDQTTTDPESAEVWIASIASVELGGVDGERGTDIILKTMKAASIKVSAEAGCGDIFVSVERKDGQRAIDLLCKCEELKGRKITIYKKPIARQPQAQQNQTADKLAIYLGVDGVCFSTDGSKYGKYVKYSDREATVSLATDDLELRIRQLKRLGFEMEHHRTLEVIDGVPPQTLTIVIQSSSVTKEVQFFCRKGLEVPERYLVVLDYLPDSKKPEALNKFIELSRQNHETLKDLIDDYTKVPTEKLRLERSLPDDVFEKLNTAESIAALNCFVRECCIDNDFQREWLLYNAMEILAKIGNNASVAAMCAMRYTTIWGRDRGKASAAIRQITKNDNYFGDEEWDKHRREWFTETENKRLDEIKIQNAERMRNP
jgi:hypothetical protein